MNTILEQCCHALSPPGSKVMRGEDFSHGTNSLFLTIPSAKLNLQWPYIGQFITVKQLRYLRKVIFLICFIFLFHFKPRKRNIFSPSNFTYFLYFYQQSFIWYSLDRVGGCWNWTQECCSIRHDSQWTWWQQKYTSSWKIYCLHMLLELWHLNSLGAVFLNKRRRPSIWILFMFFVSGPNLHTEGAIVSSL